MAVVTSNTIQPASGQALTIKDEGGTASITVATNGEATFAENIKITANKGINFSAYATSGNPSSNLLDDYEEGTWDPTNSNLHATQYGYYTKIGRYVFCTVKLNGASGSISANIAGLPFTSISDTATGVNSYGWGGGPVTWHNDTSGQTYTINVEPNDSSFYMFYGTVSKEVSNGKTYVCNFSYMTP